MMSGGDVDSPRRWFSSGDSRRPRLLLRNLAIPFSATVATALAAVMILASYWETCDINDNVAGILILVVYGPSIVVISGVLFYLCAIALWSSGGLIFYLATAAVALLWLWGFVNYAFAENQDYVRDEFQCSGGVPPWWPSSIPLPALS
ncbi:hypothetical protein [Gordonia sp. CPCC 205333]|uniref:hypothetical protein n=1 Tax=Gordonia sp. CPCC 205333 TaxID=3140790 RepID=UPI003AF3DE44